MPVSATAMMILSLWERAVRVIVPVGKFDRIAQEIHEDLLHLVAIRIQRGQVGCDLLHQPHLLAFEHWFDCMQTLGEHGAQDEFHRIDLGPAGFDLGQIEHIVDEGQQVLGADQNLFQVFVLAWLQEPLERRITRRVKPIMAFIGVRSSCDILARNSDLCRGRFELAIGFLQLTGALDHQVFQLYGMLPHLLVEPGILNGNGGLVAQGAQEPLIVVAELLRRATDNVQHPHHRAAARRARSVIRFLDHVVKGTVGIFCRVVPHHNRQTRCHNASTQTHTRAEAQAGNSIRDRCGPG